MRFIFLFGGALGFGLVLLCGWSAERNADALLRDAAIGCLVGAFLMRWFWSVVQKAYHHTLLVKQAEMRAAEEAEEAAAAAKRAAAIRAAVAPVSAPSGAAGAGAPAPALARAR